MRTIRTLFAAASVEYAVFAGLASGLPRLILALWSVLFFLISGWIVPWAWARARRDPGV